MRQMGVTLNREGIRRYNKLNHSFTGDHIRHTYNIDLMTDKRIE